MKTFTLPANCREVPATVSMRVFLARLEHRDNRPEGALTMYAVAERIAKARGTPLPAIRGEKVA